MAQVPEVSVEFDGDGTTVIYDFNFPYQTQAEVFVTVDGEPTPFAWVGGSTHSLQITPAPAVGTRIVIFRSTLGYVPKHVFAAGVPFLPRYVDENNRQLLYIAQEAITTSNDAEAIAAEVLQRIDAAEDVADSALTAAQSALATAADANATANQADSKATVALETAEGIAATAAEALVVANAADAKADEALAAVEQAGVASFNGRAGIVLPQAGDYNASMVEYGAGTVADSLDGLSALNGTQGALSIGRAVVNCANMLDLLSVRRAPDLTYHLRCYRPDTLVGSGDFYWDPGMSRTLHDGATIVRGDAVFPTDWTNNTQLSAWFSPGTGTGCFVREIASDPCFSWWGAVGEDKSANDAVPIQKALDYAKARSDINRQFTNLNGENLRYLITEPVVVRQGSLNWADAYLTQTNNLKDCVQIDGSGNTSEHLFYLHWQNITVNIAGTSTVNSGAQVRVLAGNIGWWHWNKSYLCKGGKHGVINGYNTAVGVDGKIGGILWEFTLDNVWFDATYSSPVLIPAHGGVLDFTKFDGGSTTYTFRNVHATNVATSEPAYQVGNGVDQLILDNVTADHCTRFIKTKVKSCVCRNLAMEFVKPPTDAALRAAFYAQPSYYLADFQNAFVFNLDGFAIAAGPEIVATPHSNMAYVNAEFIIGEVNGVFGSDIPNSAPIRVSGGKVTVSAVSNSLRNITANNGEILYKAHSQVDTVQKTGTFTLFPMDTTRPRVYLITTTWAFANLSSINTFLVHTSGSAGGLKGSAVNLLPAADYPGAAITFAAGNVQASGVPANTAVTWRAIDMTAL